MKFKPRGGASAIASLKIWNTENESEEKETAEDTISNGGYGKFHCH